MKLNETQTGKTTIILGKDLVLRLLQEMPRLGVTSLSEVIRAVLWKALEPTRREGEQ